MKTVIEQIDRVDLRELISLSEHGNLDQDQEQIFERFLVQTAILRAGFVDGHLICAWGLVPPTLMSEQAYLWLYVTEAVKEHTFLFVRYSQLAVGVMLKEYPLIVGHCIAGKEQSIRWLRWLGAKFGEPQGKLIPFQIRAK